MDEQTTEGRSGFDIGFLTAEVAFPELDAKLKDDLVEVEGSPRIPYTHFTVALSETRKLARWVGWNIDGGAMKLLSRSSLSFKLDPRIPAEFQTGNELYAGNRLDRGHIARRADLTWGDEAEAQYANADSFFFTNISPQMEDFNQSRQGGLWGRLENALYEDVEVDQLRCSVFGGPVFHEDDQLYRGVQIPTDFWKLIVFEQARALKARAFMLTQSLDRLSVLMALDAFKVYQIAVTELEERTGLVFSDIVRQADDVVLAQATERQPLTALTDIAW